VPGTPTRADSCGGSLGAGDGGAGGEEAAEGAKTNGKGQELVQDEERETGLVKVETCHAYLESVGRQVGPPYSLILLLLLFTRRVLAGRWGRRRGFRVWGLGFRV